MTLFALRVCHPYDMHAALCRYGLDKGEGGHLWRIDEILLLYQWQKYDRCHILLALTPLTLRGFCNTNVEISSRFALLPMPVVNMKG